MWSCHQSHGTTRGQGHAVSPLCTYSSEAGGSGRSRGAGGAGKSGLSRDAIAARGACGSPWASGASVSLGSLDSCGFLVRGCSRVVFGADRAALAGERFRAGTVLGVFTDHFIAQDVALVAHADLAVLRFPYFAFTVPDAVLHACDWRDVFALVLNLAFLLAVRQEGGGR